MLIRLNKEMKIFSRDTAREGLKPIVNGKRVYFVAAKNGLSFIQHLNGFWIFFFLSFSLSRSILWNWGYEHFSYTIFCFTTNSWSCARCIEEHWNEHFHLTSLCLLASKTLRTEDEEETDTESHSNSLSLWSLGLINQIIMDLLPSIKILSLSFTFFLLNQRIFVN